VIQAPHNLYTALLRGLGAKYKQNVGFFDAASVPYRDGDRAARKEAKPLEN
jgi:hypothetical protein